MSEQEYRTISDEYGELTQYMTSRGSWSNFSRTINGVTFMLKDRKTVDYLLALKAGKVELRLNVMNDGIEVWGNLKDLPDVPTRLSDILQANITNWMQDIGLVGKDRMLDAIATGAYRNQYHPIKDYLNGLTWDGEDRIAKLCAHLDFDDVTTGAVFFRRWLIGAVAKIMELAQNFMLVMDGPQGIGKSYLARWLCPLPDYFIEGAIQPDDKDSYKRLISNWLWEVGELEGTTRKSDRAALKDFITRREVTLRVPYGKYDITKPAAASLIGTINEDGAGFLNDPTGSRRFAVVKLIDIDYAYTHIDVDQLWAQVMHLYQAGEPWELQPEERKAQVVINEMYEADSPVEQLLRRHYEWSLEDEAAGSHFMPSVEVLDTLRLSGLHGNDRANLMEISTILKREGLQKKRVNGLMGFYGIRKRDQKVIQMNGNITDYAKIDL